MIIKNERSSTINQTIEINKHNNIFTDGNYENVTLPFWRQLKTDYSSAVVNWSGMKDYAFVFTESLYYIEFILISRVFKTLIESWSGISEIDKFEGFAYLIKIFIDPVLLSSDFIS